MVPWIRNYLCIGSNCSMVSWIRNYLQINGTFRSLFKAEFKHQVFAWVYPIALRFFITYLGCLLKKLMAQNYQYLFIAKLCAKIYIVYKPLLENIDKICYNKTIKGSGRATGYQIFDGSNFVYDDTLKISCLDVQMKMIEGCCSSGYF